MKIWIDIENPPQVQYLLPLRRAFEERGVETAVTARDYETTVELLHLAGLTPPVFGRRVGRSKLLKAVAVLYRAAQLARFFTATGRPDAVVAASRPASIAAWWLDIPSFTIGDYEHADGRVLRYTRSTLLHPDVIRITPRHRGLRREQLVPFRGLKEDLTFAGVDVAAITPHDLGSAPPNSVRVLFRPPSETSHYYREASTALARAALSHLAGAEVSLIFLPRERGQLRLLDGLDFRHEPIVITRPVPFVSLLKSVDAVVCSGGTMLREAAYLGIPAYSIFGGAIGAVDRWLQQIGRVTLIEGPTDVGRIELKRRGAMRRLDTNPGLLGELAELVLRRAAEGRVSRDGPLWGTLRHMTRGASKLIPSEAGRAPGARREPPATSSHEVSRPAARPVASPDASSRR